MTKDEFYKKYKGFPAELHTDECVDVDEYISRLRLSDLELVKDHFRNGKEWIKFREQKIKEGEYAE